MIGIYKITNKINGKIYIGQSININKRINEHFWKSFNQKDVSFNSILHQAIRKYGKENFSWEVLQECDVKEIDSLEKKYIEQYDCISPKGYNILPGGQKNRAFPILCPICKKPVSQKGVKCIECSHLEQRIVDRPDREEFKKMVYKESFVQIASRYGVSDKAISKWCKGYNLPHRKKDIKLYSFDEWMAL